VFGPPTALALPLKMGDFGMSRWQLPCKTTPILREVGSAAMSLPGTKLPFSDVRAMSVIEAASEVKYSLRVFRMLTQLGHERYFIRISWSDCGAR
jgi:hypothetical protein